MSAMGTENRVIRPAAVVPERAARLMLAWLKEHDVSAGGCWSHDIGSIQRYSGPFDGPGGMRGTSRLLGSIHITWDRFEVTIYRAHVTDEGVARGVTVDSLCDEALQPAGLTLANCPRANLAPAPPPDPFKPR